MGKFTDYTEKVTPDDVDIFLLQDSAATKKVSFLNIFNRVKTKLGLGTLATKNTISQADLEAALLSLINGKLGSSDIVNNLTSTDTTKVLSAAQGKTLKDGVDGLNSNIQTLTTSLQSLSTALNGLSVATTTYTSLNIDGVVQAGTIEITYIRLQKPDVNRAVFIGFAVSASDSATYTKFVSTNKLLIRKNIETTWTSFTSI